MLGGSAAAAWVARPTLLRRASPRLVLPPPLLRPLHPTRAPPAAADTAGGALPAAAGAARAARAAGGAADGRGLRPRAHEPADQAACGWAAEWRQLGLGLRFASPLHNPGAALSLKGSFLCYDYLLADDIRERVKALGLER